VIQAPNVHVSKTCGRVGANEISYVIADASVKRAISKSIQVDFWSKQKKTGCNKTVQRRGRIHDYMNNGVIVGSMRGCHPRLASHDYDPDIPGMG